MSRPNDRVEPENDRPVAPKPLVGAVLCGGRSSRFGSDKAAAQDDGMALGARVVAALRDGGVDPVVAIGGTAGPALAIPTVADLRPGQGPLGGLATALLWAKTGSVLVVPCDLPLLQPSHVAALITAHEQRQPGTVQTAIIATVGGEPKVSLGLWPAPAGRRLLQLVDGGTRRFRAALEVIDWRGVEVPGEALEDADTPEDLRRLSDRRAR